MLYLLSMVLVTSTFAASIYFHLPSELYGIDGGEVAARVARHADVLSVFWGAVYALTLIATIAVPATRLQRRIAGLSEGSTPEGDAAADADGDVADTLIGQARLCLALLAPLIAGRSPTSCMPRNDPSCRGRRR